jgi:hypothetical protein
MNTPDEIAKAFDEWWKGYWTPLQNHPEILNQLFYDISLKAWIAGYEHGKK